MEDTKSGNIEPELPVVSIAANGVSLVFNRPLDQIEHDQQKQIWTALANSFAYLFSGNPKGFYVRWDDGTYHAVHREPRWFDWLAHLCGYEDRSMLSVPVRPDGTCLWAAIDLDRHESGDEPVEWGALACLVTALKLPLVVCQSKGGKGAWLFCFFREREKGVPASDARRLMEHYANLLSLGTVEIFPKQSDLETAKGLGSGINLPYHPGHGNTVGYSAEGQELDYINEFLDCCWERSAFASVLLRDLPEAPADSGSVVRASPVEVKEHPMKVSRARELHEKNIASLQAAKPGNRNDTLNTVCFFAGRAFQANALEGTEAHVKDAIRKAARFCGMYDAEIDATGASGWASGIASPLTIVQPPSLPWRNSSEQIVVAKSPAIIDKLLYKASSTGLIGKPKMGKTTLALDIAEAVIDGKPFLKEETISGSVLYVSEQPLGSFVAELQNSGLLGNGTPEQLILGSTERKRQFHFVTIEDWFKFSWTDIVEATVEQAAKLGACLVIFDTLSRIARVEEENSASEMQRAVDEMTPFFEKGISTLCIQHERKAGGDIQDAGRGTNALTGAVDVILHLNRPEGKHPSSYRQLEFIGRFPGPNAPRILDRKTADSASRYELLGNVAAVKSVNSQQTVMELFIDDGVTLTEAEIVEVTSLDRSAVHRALGKLVEDGLLNKKGEGKRMSPFQFRRKETPF